MKLCTDTITILNGKLDEETGYDVYYPTVVSGVSWYADTVSTVNADGLKAADRITVRIPLDADFSGKSFVPPSEYESGDPDSVFTLKAGDVIAYGIVTGEHLTPSALRELGGEVVTVLSVTDNRRATRAQHWKVVCK